MRVKRGLSLLLCCAILVGLLPTVAFAAYDIGDTVTNKTGVAPDAVAGAVWVEETPEKERICGVLIEHIHDENCYTKNCDHRNGHLPSCYSSSTEYQLCEHSDNSEHTGYVTVRDVVTYDVTYKTVFGTKIPSNIEIKWNKEHPAYTVVYAQYQKYFNESKLTTELLKNIEVMGKLYLDKFCYTTTSEPDLCKHTCSEVGGKCYKQTCILTAHKHTDDCYETTYKWTLHADANGNGVADDTETYTVIYKNGENTLKTCTNVKYGEATPTTDEPTGEEGFVFDGWDPVVAETVSAPSKGTEIVYTAKWKPDVDDNEDGIPDGQQKNTVRVVSSNATVTVNGAVVENGKFAMTDILKDVEIEVELEEDCFLEKATLNGENITLDKDNTYTFTAGVKQTYDLVISAVEKKHTQVNVKANPTIDYKGKAISDEEVLKALFTSVTSGDDVVTIDANKVEIIKKSNLLVKDYTLAKQNSVLGWVAKGNSIEKGAMSDATGTWRIILQYPGDDQHQASEELTVEFEVVDGREEATLTLHDATHKVTDMTNATLDEDAIIDLLHVSHDGEGELSVTFISKGDSVVPVYTGVTGTPEISGLGTYEVTITLGDTAEFKGTSAKATLTVVDGRVPTQLTLNEGVTFTYDPEITEKDIYDLVFASLTTNPEEGEKEDVEPVYGENISLEIDSLDAGTHTVTVKYDGDNTHAATSAEVEITIEKAKASVSVPSQTITYGTPYSMGIGTTPAGIDTVTLVAGIDGDGAGFVSLLLPDSIVNNPVFNAILSKVEGDVSLSGLSGVISGIADVIGKWDSSVDTSAITALCSILDKIPLDATVRFRMTLPTDAGVYAVASSTIDGNYETAYGAGYLVILPQTSNVTLKFDQDVPADCIITDPDSFDFSATMYCEDEALGDKYVNYLYMAVTSNQEKPVDLYVGTTPSKDYGAYIQMAYGLGGNYVAKPIYRTYVIAKSTMKESAIVFDDATVAVVYDGEAHGLSAKVVDGNGDAIEGATATLTYVGVTADGTSYKSTEKPTEIGVYSVFATWEGDKVYRPAAAVGALTIAASKMEKASIVFDENPVKVVYDGEAHGLTATVVDGDGKAISGAEAKLQYVGVTANGKSYNSSKQPTEVGAYTVTATYAGDRTYRPAVAVGALAIVASAMEESHVVFTGGANHLVVYDGQPHSLSAIAIDSEGGEIAGAEVTIRYVGVDVDTGVEFYNSTEAPSAIGAYTVTATYAGDRTYRPAANVGSLVIAPTGTNESRILFEESWMCVTYDGEPHGLKATVVDCNKAPISGAKATLRYIGVTAKGECYNSTTEPTEVGVYKVTASFAGNSEYLPSVNCGLLIIKPDCSGPVVPPPTPSEEPTPTPSEEPTPAPSVEPAPVPSTNPSPVPSTEPTPTTSEEPTPAPSANPKPSDKPGQNPETKPSNTPDKDAENQTSPSTGDASNMSLWAMLMGAAFAGLAVVAGFTFRRRRRQQ